jgi:drug/metabolite transporter (DMT)-like permease
VVASRSTVGAALVALSALLFGIVGVLAREAFHAGFDVAGLLAFRLVFSALILTSACALVARRSGARYLGRPGRAALRAGFFGAVFLSAQTALIFLAFERIPVAIALALFYTYPVMVLVGASVGARSAPRPIVVASLLASMVGVVLVVGAGGQIDGSLVGYACAIASGLLYAIFFLVSHRLVQVDSPLRLGARYHTGMAIVFVAWFVAHDHARLDVSAVGWVWLALLVVVGTVVPLAAQLAGLRRVVPVTASMISMLEPISSACYAALLLSERLGPQQIAGSVLVLVASLVCATSSARERGARPGSATAPPAAVSPSTDS